jgi:hypothetical protein
MNVACYRHHIGWREIYVILSVSVFGISFDIRLAK